MAWVILTQKYCQIPLFQTVTLNFRFFKLKTISLGSAQPANRLLPPSWKIRRFAPNFFCACLQLGACSQARICPSVVNYQLFQTPAVSKYFSFSLRVRNIRVQLYENEDKFHGKSIKTILLFCLEKTVFTAEIKLQSVFN